MSLRPGEPVSLGQYFWLVAVSVVAGGVYVWPQTLVLDAGPNALWAIGASVLASCLFTWCELCWAERVPGRGYADRLLRTWGMGAWLWLVGNVCLCVVIDAALIKLFTQMLTVYFHPRTPGWMLFLLVAAIAAWLAAQPLATVARNVQFWMPLILFSFFLLFALAAFSMRTWPVLRPSWPPSWQGLAAGLFATWYLWQQDALAVTVAAHVRGADFAALRRTAMAGLLFQGAIVVLIYGLVVGVLGPWATKLVQWPLSYVFTSIRPLTFFVARPGFFVLPTWLAAVMMYLVVRMYCGSYNLSLLAPSTPRGLIVLGFLTAFFFTGLLYTSPSAISSFLVHTVDPLSLAWVGGQALLSWLLVVLRLAPRVRAA